MKKLFYLLFAFAIIVACEKDMDESYNVDSISPINAVVESPEMSAQDAFNFLNNSFKGIDTSVKSVSSSTARTDSSSDWLHVIFSENNGVHVAKLNSEEATETCANGSDVSFIYRYAAPVLTIIDAAGAETPFNLSSSLVTRYNGVFGANVDQFVRVNAARNQIASGAVPAISLFDFSCAPAAVDTDISTTATGVTLTFDGVNVWDGTIVEGTVGSVVVSGGFAAGTGYYDAQGNQVSSTIDLATLPVGPNRFTFRSRVNGQGSSITGYVNITVTSSTPVASAWTVGQDVLGNTVISGALGSYRISAAPFPLTGILATVVTKTGDASDRTVANYAGTGTYADQSTWTAVREAIELDFTN